jgi:phosphoenolpyruvate carboxylase
MPHGPHKPLRDAIRLLGDLLGETLHHRAGQTGFATLEAVRALSKSAREGGEADPPGSLVCATRARPLDRHHAAGRACNLDLLINCLRWPLEQTLDQ